MESYRQPNRLEDLGGARVFCFLEKEPQRRHADPRVAKRCFATAVLVPGKHNKVGHKARRGVAMGYLQENAPGRGEQRVPLVVAGTERRQCEGRDRIHDQQVDRGVCCLQPLP